MKRMLSPRMSNRSHCAHYMVLVGPSDAPRALLFNGECRYLAEMFDEDGMLLENLVKSSRVCPAPSDLKFDGVVPAPATCGAEPLRCFELR